MLWGGDDDGGDVAMLRRVVMSHAPLGYHPRGRGETATCPPAATTRCVCCGRSYLVMLMFILSLPVPRDKNWIPVVVI